MMTELGIATTLEDCYRDYMGKRFHEVLAAIASRTGRRLPPGFAEDFRRRTLKTFRAELQPVAGVREFIAAFADVPQCIASSSAPDRLAVCLQVLGLEAWFTGRVFSASLVARGKPHPDIFLHAAAALEVPPGRCIVIEDSAGGIVAGRAAGATVIGLLAGGHVRDGHGATLAAAGAHHVVDSFRDAEAVVRALLR